MALKVGGFVAGLVLDYVLDAILASYIASSEREITEIERPFLLARWKDNVYSRIEEKLEAIIGLEPFIPESGRFRDGGAIVDFGARQYIHVRWETIHRLQANSPVSDTAVWIAKFAAGDPGFVELLEDVRHVSHRITPYNHAPRPRRYFDKLDEWLLHQEHDQFIMVWDRGVHQLANRYRATQKRCLELIGDIEQQIEFEIVGVPPARAARIRTWLIDGQLAALREEIGAFNFTAAIIRLRGFKGPLRGQFALASIDEHRIQRVLAEAGELQQFIASREIRRAQQLDSVEAVLLGMFLNQNLEHL